MKRFLPALLLGVLMIPVPVAAQSFAVAGHLGTLGVGGSAIFQLSPRLNARGTLGLIPTEPEFTVDAVDFTVEFPSFARVTADFYPVGFFYLSAGGLFVTSGGEITVTGQFTGSQDFGGTTYSAAQVGTLTGVFGLSSAMPYLGVGFGNPIGRRVGLNLDLGVGIGSVPTVDLAADGPIASDPILGPIFRADLDLREAEFEADIPQALRYYPVLNLGLTISLG